MINTTCKNKFYFAGLILIAQIISGCATMDEFKGKLKIPSVGGSTAKSAYSQFPKSQMPHTMLKKPVAKGSITSKYGYRLNPTGIPLPKKHAGVDFRADTGTSIFAAADGVIIDKRISNSYGKLIKISHDNGFSTFYAHMDTFGTTLEKGTEVSKGQVIGTVGTTGKSTGPHLHFELHYRGKKVNPHF